MKMSQSVGCPIPGRGVTDFTKASRHRSQAADLSVFSMAISHIRADREQLTLMPPDMREWLPEGHLGALPQRLVPAPSKNAENSRQADGTSRRLDQTVPQDPPSGASFTRHGATAPRRHAGAARA
jgi:hypothetical protein